MHSYYLINKPFNMLSQFTKDCKKFSTLTDLNFIFPKDVYAVGRLDADSEGLLLLTNDKSVNNRLLNPRNKHKRTYYVQVDFSITPDALLQLCTGVTLSINGVPYFTQPAVAKIIDNPLWIIDRIPPVRARKNIPTSWISLTLIEDKNRQVRRMTAAVGNPTLRLIRYSIENHCVENIKIGQVVELNKQDFYIGVGWGMG